MTRPMTKAQLSLIAVPIDGRRREDSLVRFLMEAVLAGTVIGVGVATSVLLSDTFGLIALMRSQSHPLATAFAFILSGAVIFAPISLAVAVGLSAGMRDHGA